MCVGRIVQRGWWLCCMGGGRGMLRRIRRTLMGRMYTCPLPTAKTLTKDGVKKANRHDRYAKCVIPFLEQAAMSRSHTTRLHIMIANMWIEFSTIIWYVPYLPLYHSSFSCLTMLTQHSLAIYILLAIHAHRSVKCTAASAEIRMQDLERMPQYTGEPSPALHDTVH
jgi:hypothetical protein